MMGRGLPAGLPDHPPLQVAVPGRCSSGGAGAFCGYGLTGTSSIALWLQVHRPIPPQGHAPPEGLAGPIRHQEAILYAELDLGNIPQSRFDFDAVGQYARPSVFQLSVDESPKQSAKAKKSRPVAPGSTGL